LLFSCFINAVKDRILTDVFSVHLFSPTSAPANCITLLPFFCFHTSTPIMRCCDPFIPRSPTSGPFPACEHGPGGWRVRIGQPRIGQAWRAPPFLARFPNGWKCGGEGEGGIKPAEQRRGKGRGQMLDSRPEAQFALLFASQQSVARESCMSLTRV